MCVCVGGRRPRGHAARAMRRRTLASHSNARSLPCGSSKNEQATMNSFFFPRSLFYAAPPMVAVPTFLPPFYSAPPMVAVPTLRPAAPIPTSSTVFTIGRDEPPCLADHVRAFMNRPRNSLLKLDAAVSSSEEHGGFIVDETAGEPVFPMRFGKLPTDNVIPASDVKPVAATTTAVEVAEAAPAPALPSPQAPEPTAAASVQPAPKTVSKPRSKTTSSAQWPTRQSVVSTVSSAVVPELFNSLFSGDLHTHMQHVRTGSKKVAVTLPKQLPCGKAVIVTDRLVGQAYGNAIWQQLGEAVAERVGHGDFSLWVQMLQHKDGVQAEARLEWGPE